MMETPITSRQRQKLAQRDLPPLPEGARSAVFGLVLPERLSREEWDELAPRFRAIYSMTQWQLGDWLRYGEWKWGRKYVAAEELTGRHYKTLANIVRVARTFPVHRRRTALTWSHHEVVARLPEEEQERLLTLAEVNLWPVAKLRREAAAGNQNAKCKMQNAK